MANEHLNKTHLECRLIRPVVVVKHPWFDRIISGGHKKTTRKENRSGHVYEYWFKLQYKIGIKLLRMNSNIFIGSNDLN